MNGCVPILGRLAGLAGTVSGRVASGVAHRDGRSGSRGGPDRRATGSSTRGV